MAIDMREIRDLIDYIKRLDTGISKSTALATLAMSKDTEILAKRNATQQFTGRNGRRLSGQLLNSIFSGVERTGPNTYESFVGTRGIPYGAIHEFGGTIKPVRAKNLWIPHHANTRRMTPREFMALKRANPSEYFLNDKVAGRWISKNPNRLMPLFFLTKQSVIPERPYLRPAIEVAMEQFPNRFEQFMKREV